MKRYPVVVSKAPVKVEAVHISKHRINIAVGTSNTLTAVVSPACILDKPIVWSSSNESVVEVVTAENTIFGAAQAIVKGVGQGQAVVKASCGGKTNSCVVNVSENNIPIQEIVLDQSQEINIDETLRLSVSVNSDAVDEDIVWLSSDRDVATVNQEGIVKGYRPGIVHIYAIAMDSLSPCQRVVVAELQSMRSLSKDSSAIVKLRELMASPSVVWSECVLTVKDSSPFLRNLHAPSEAVTAYSALLLWNRASLYHAKELDHYRVYCNDKLLAATTKLGYTAKGLQPGSSYQFRVEAVSSSGELLACEFVSVGTKPAPTAVINVMDQPYGAVGSGKVMDTAAIQQAIDDCPEGGTVLLPAGHVFCSGALFLKSNMTFQVDGILIGSTDPKDYPPIITRWNGLRKLHQPAAEWESSSNSMDNQYAHASLINAGVYDEGAIGRTGPYNVRNLVICGTGQINGNGFKLAYNEGPHPKLGNGGRPVPESTKLDPSVRGRTITLHNAQNIYIADLTIAYGPAWTVHPVYCDRITFDNLEVISKGTGKTGAADDICILNGDGIDPDSSTNVQIFNCRFFTGDDAVALKSGRNHEGNLLRKPTAYVRVTDCVSRGSKGGFCIGSEQSGGVHDVLWQNLVVDSINLHGLWIKASEARGGVVEDVLWKDCWIHRANTGINLQLDYDSSTVNSASLPPEIRFITFENIHCSRINRSGVRIKGLANSCIHDITIRGCSFATVAANEHGFWINCVYKCCFENVKLTAGTMQDYNNT